MLGPFFVKDKDGDFVEAECCAGCTFYCAHPQTCGYPGECPFVYDIPGGDENEEREGNG